LNLFTFTGLNYGIYGALRVSGDEISAVIGYDGLTLCVYYGLIRLVSIFGIAITGAIAIAHHSI
jgi:hypothetical protein